MSLAPHAVSPFQPFPVLVPTSGEHQRTVRKYQAVGFVLLLFLLIPACMPSPRWVDYVARQNPDLLFSVPTRDSVVALTIDDGPHPTLTPRLLDVLRENEARATFFIMSNNVTGNEALLQRMKEEGHELGHHMRTAVPSVVLGRERFMQEFVFTDSLLRAYGVGPWFRPASGVTTRGMKAIAEAHGYRVALGNVYPNDAQNPFAPLLADYILRNVRPGSVIVLHDGFSWRVRTVHVLRRVLPQLRERGYRIVTLSELEIHAAR